MIHIFIKFIVETKKKYSVMDKELLAILKSIDYFKYYLLRKRFTLETDQHALKYLKQATHPNNCMMRGLYSYITSDFEVRYIAYETNFADFFKQAYRNERKVRIKIGNQAQIINLERF